MAGRPQRAAAFAVIEANIELVEAELSAGKTQRAVAEMLGISESNFGRWVTKNETGRAVLSRARARAAHAVTEEGMMLAEQLLRRPVFDSETGEPLVDRLGNPVYREPTTGEIQATKLVIDTRFKMAGIWNKAEFAQQPGAINVNVNLGSAALDSLRKAQVAPDVIDVEPTMQPALEGPSLDDLL